MPSNLIKNLYVPFGIPFDPKRYYKDGAHTRMLRRLNQQRNVQYGVLDASQYDVFSGDMAPLPHRNLRHPWLRYQVDGYDEGIEEMTELGFRAYWPAPSYFHIRDPVRRLCHRRIACSISGRGQGAEKSGAQLFGGHFIGRLAAHFGLISDEGLRGLSVVVSELPAAAGGALTNAEGAPAADEGAQVVPSPVQAPQPPPPAPQPQTILWMPVGVLIRHLTAPSSAAHDFPTRGVSDLGQAMPAPPQLLESMTSPTLDLFPLTLLITIF
ncbi:hypothetical protein Tco_0589964 [Tanacetum coccineum]